MHIIYQSGDIMFNQKFLLNNLISKANLFLGSLQKAIPIYENSKPILDKLFNIKNKISNLNFNKIKIKQNNITTNKKEEIISISSPQFFL